VTKKEKQDRDAQLADCERKISTGEIMTYEIAFTRLHDARIELIDQLIQPIKCFINWIIR
jgi:hypothetical protein